MALTNYSKVIELVKQNYDKLQRENLSSKSGYEKVVLYMKDILRNAGVPENSQKEYLSRETISKCIKDAANSINRAHENAERSRLAAIKNEERIEAAKCSIIVPPKGKAKTADFCRIAIEYYKFQIEACDIATSIIKGNCSSQNALFNHTSNTWAYHGGIASAIAGPAAGIMAAAEAKREDDARNQLNAQIRTLNTQIASEKLIEIMQVQKDYKESLVSWTENLEATRYQLEEKCDQNKLLRAMNPQVFKYTTSETGTVTLEIDFSRDHNCKIYGEKEAYIDGSIVVQFSKDGKVYGSTLCYLPFGGTDSHRKIICINTELPNLKKSQGCYDIKFLPGDLYLVESLPEITTRYYSDYFYTSLNNWCYEKAEKEKAAKEAALQAQEAKERLKKKRKALLKKFMPLIVTLSTTLVASIVLLIVFFPNLKYNSAVRKYNKQEYSEAASIFRSLGDFKDSYDMKIKSYMNAQDYPSVISCGITDLVIPDGITEISHRQFAATFDDGLYSRITSIVIPDSVTSIGNQAFYNCNSLKRIVIPDSVTKIGTNAFDSCDSLTEVIIGKNVTTIGEGAFYNCNNLTQVTLVNGMTSIPDNALKNCESLKNVIIPDSITSIGNYAFYGCTSLTSITIPDSVTSIGRFAFRGCESLTSITIPDSVTSIREYAFSDCSNLTEIIFENPNGWSVMRYDGVLNVDSNELSNSSTACNYLCIEFADRKWHRTET